MRQPLKNQSSVKSTSENLTDTTNHCSSVYQAITNVSLQSVLGLADKYIIGYRTVRGYVREDLSEALKSRLKLRYVRGKGWIYVYNNAEIIFTFSKYKQWTTCIEFSIPRLLNKEKTRIATRNDARTAIELVSNLIGKDFSCFNISRLDITSNFKCLGGLETYKNLLLKPSGYSGCTILQNSVIFHNHICQDKSGRLLVFYKMGDIVRVEARFTSAPSVNLKELIPHHLGHSSKISEILTESFYDNSVHYFYDLVLNSIAHNVAGYKAEEDATVKNLQENYDYTYESKQQTDIF